MTLRFGKYVDASCSSSTFLNRISSKWYVCILNLIKRENCRILLICLRLLVVVLRHLSGGVDFMTDRTSFVWICLDVVNSTNFSEIFVTVGERNLSPVCLWFRNLF